MKIIIYPGSEENLEHFRDFCLTNEVDLYEEFDCIGVRLTFEADFDYKLELVEFISRFITETYLENYILCKIYDEYPSIELFQTSEIIEKFIIRFGNELIGGIIGDLLEKNGKINLPSLLLFNIKRIMLTTNAIVDNICNSLILQGKYDVMFSFVKGYNMMLNKGFDEKQENEFFDEFKTTEQNVDVKPKK